MYFYSRPDSSDRIILVRFWDTKNGHDRIADKFLDEPLVFIYHLRNFVKDTASNFLYLFRVKLLGHGCISRKI